MPKKRATPAPEVEKREIPSRAAREKKRGFDGLFNPASTAPKPPKQAKKKKVATKKKKKLTRKTKPTYLVMIRRALKDLNNRNGSSLFAIYKYISDNYPVADNFHRYVSSALKKGVADGVLTRVRLSYRLTPKGKSGIVRKKRSKSKSKTTKKKPDDSGKKRKRTTKKSKKDSTTSKKKKSTEKKKAAPKKKKSKSSSDADDGEKEKEKTIVSKRSKTKKTDTGSSTTTTTSYVSPAGYKFRWQYMDGAWKDYEANASDVVETAYLGYLKNPGMCDVRSVKSGQWQYQVDFLNMKQTNIQHENHTTRGIRRLPLNG